MTYPESGLARSLAIIARLIAGGLRTRIYKVTIGNFDTHGGQAPVHAALLGMLSEGIKAFQDDIIAHGAAGRVVGMTYSEFGRRARENGQGTDHGTAAPHVVFGSMIDGGKIFGGAPDLANLDANGNLRHAIDFHCYYASVLAPLFDVDDTRLARILPVEHCGRPEFVPLYHASGIAGSTVRDAGPPLEIYPNPASQLVWIRSAGTGSTLLRVVDERGAVVMEKPVRIGSQPLALDLSALPAGVYVVSIGASVGRVVVSR